MVTMGFGESTINRKQVQLWYYRLKEGWKDVNDDARPGRPRTSTTDENIETYHSAHASQFVQMF